MRPLMIIAFIALLLLSTVPWTAPAEPPRGIYIEVIPEREPTLEELIEETSRGWGLDEQLLRAIVAVESSGGRQVRGRVERHYLSRCEKMLGVGKNTAPYSRKEAIELCARSLGPAQVMGHYALSLGVSLEEAQDWKTNLELAAHKLHWCFSRFKGDKRILCYNGLGGDGSYVQKVKTAMEEEWKQDGKFLTAY